MVQLRMTSRAHYATANYEGACLSAFVTFRRVGSDDISYCCYMTESDLLEKANNILEALDTSYQAGFEAAEKEKE